VTLNIAVANGLGNAKKLVKSVQGGEKQYHFVEVRGTAAGVADGTVRNVGGWGWAVEW
jgi:NADP-reducing hydrogenase subunit HndD